MYAIAIDGEHIATLVNRAQVVEKLKDRQIRERLEEHQLIELASFDFDRRKWIPICLNEFAHAA